MHNEIKYHSYINTPLGPIEIAGDDDFVSTVKFVTEAKTDTKHLPKVIRDCKEQLEEYFAGTRTEFSLMLSQSGTDFQRRVWTALIHIPFGKTTSYLALAKELGDVKAIRAVGTANGRNNIAIIVPCHRVIGSNGTLVGYAGGLDKKKWLLDFESRHTGQQTLDF
jgi:methylated-DNA-[protein]-cysteine S-methyltransferase